MEELIIAMRDDMTYQLQSETPMDLDALTVKLNMRDVGVLAIGEMVTHKSTIKYVKQTSTEEPTIQLTTHDGAVVVASPPIYEPLALEQVINQPEVVFIRLGNIVINKGYIRTITPLSLMKK